MVFRGSARYSGLGGLLVVERNELAIRESLQVIFGTGLICAECGQAVFVAVFLRRHTDIEHLGSGRTAIRKAAQGLCVALKFHFAAELQNSTPAIKNIREAR
jgi:hypothetical protein